MLYAIENETETELNAFQAGPHILPELRPFARCPPCQPTLAYLEVRGLHVRGNGDTAREKYPDELGKFTPNTDIQ